MRNALDLYANLRPSLSSGVNVCVLLFFPSACSLQLSLFLLLSAQQSKPGVDLLIVRENTECLYVKKERLYVEVHPSGLTTLQLTGVEWPKAGHR